MRLLRRFLLPALLGALLLSSAAAEIVGYAGEELILRWTAPGGQSIYFTAPDEQFTVSQGDLNSDGLSDLAVRTVLNGTEVRHALFLQTASGYVPVRTGEAVGSYTILRSSGRLLTVSGSSTGAHTACLYRWEGSTLYPLRRAVCEPWSETTWQDGGWRMVCEDGRLHVRVSDYTTAMESVIFETLCTPEELAAGVYDTEQSALLYGAAGLLPAVVCAQTSDRVYLRSQPDRDSAAKGLYYTGTAVHCGETQGEWTAVTVGTEEGWMMTAYIVTGEQAALVPSLARAATATNGDWIAIYRDPSDSAEPIFNIQAGTQVSVLGELSNGWCYVSAAGVTGYMSPMFLLR